jgi:hypothetical protein
MSGLEVLTVWTRDSEEIQSFSNILYYSTKKAEGVMSQILKQVDLGNIIQQEVSSDGRLIVFHEEHSKTVKVLY